MMYRSDDLLNSRPVLKSTTVHTSPSRKARSITPSTRLPSSNLTRIGSREVTYPVPTFGTILGMGKDRRALPWHVLKYDAAEGAYVIDVDADLLKNGPAYDEANTDWEDPDWG